MAQVLLTLLVQVLLILLAQVLLTLLSLPSSHRARTWSLDHLNQLPMGSFVAQTQLTQTLQSLRNGAQLSTAKVVELAGRVLQSLCLANTQLESVASLLATKVALLFLCLFL